MFNHSIDLCDDMSYLFDRLIQSSTPETSFYDERDSYNDCAFVCKRLCVAYLFCILLFSFILASKCPQKLTEI